MSAKLPITILALALALPAFAAAQKGRERCPEGKVKTRGECFDACPTQGTFAQPSSCECPPGYGKILSGNGGGECRRLACATGAVIDPKSCVCPPAFELKKLPKGKARCVARTAKATPKAKATGGAPAKANGD